MAIKLDFDLAAFHLVKQLYLEPYERIAPGLSNSIMESMIENISKDLIKKIELHLPGKGEVIYATVVKAYNRHRKFQQALIADVNYFDYVGFERKDSRPFCLNLLKQAQKGKRWHITEILQMYNGSNLSVNIFCGGENCRHDWEPDPFYEN